MDDAVELMRRLAESPGGLSRTFNVGTATTELTIREVAESVIGGGQAADHRARADDGGIAVAPRWT